jgi:hypothetical protein
MAPISHPSILVLITQFTIAIHEPRDWSVVGAAAEL